MIGFKITKIINFQESNRYEQGYAHLGFHDYYGNLYTVDYDKHYVGMVDNNKLKWSAGKTKPVNSEEHFYIDLTKPKYISGSKDKSIIIAGDRYVHRIYPRQRRTEVVIDKDKFGLKDIGNCVYDSNNNIWVNEITGCRVWQFSYSGELLHCLGTGKAGFNKNEVGYKQVKFNWIFDMRLGNDGHLYILDSKNFAVRRVNIAKKTVELVAGTGKGGYSGDGGHAINASFGSNKNSTFDGPWSLSIDEHNNLYIGDTQNHVVRMIDNKTKIITTIAGCYKLNNNKRNDITETNALKLNLNLICSLNYHDKHLYIPKWDGDLIVLQKQGE